MMDEWIASLPCEYCDNEVPITGVTQHQCFRGYDTVVVTNGKFSGAFVRNITEGEQGENSNLESIGGDEDDSIETENVDLESDVNNNDDGVDPNELLIMSMKEHPCLYNVHDKKLIPLKTPANKRKEWNEAHKPVKEYFPTLTDLKKRWKNLYDTFKRILKEEKSKRSGDKNDKNVGEEPKWKYWKLMSFLIDSELSYNNFTESSLDGDDQSGQCCDNQSELVQSDQNPSVVGQNPERIDERQSKRRKKESALEQIASALSNPPVIQMPNITFPPPPPPPPFPSSPSSRGRKVDAIKAFIMFAEEKLRSYTPEVAEQLMLKIHQLFFTAVEG